MRAVFALLVSLVAVVLGARAQEPRTDVFVESRDHPAIAYTSTRADDAVARLNEQLERGAVQLSFDSATGYLRSTLDALRIPVDSQMLVFSATSAQADAISPKNPRALYFNDSAAVGWVRGEGLLELAAVDPRQGAIFYTLAQKPQEAPRFTRDQSCLLCHHTWDTLGVPGLMALSTFQMSDDPNEYATGLVTDHRTPFSQRWGGWYVTGGGRMPSHLGNVPVIVPKSVLKQGPKPTPRLESVAGQFDTTGYLAPYSDVVALMVLDHQTHMSNLITRLGWETRVATAPARGGNAAGGAAGGATSGAAAGPGAATGAAAGALPARVDEAVRDLVDYLLMIEAAPIAGRIEGSSGFARRFAAQGPMDSKGRSLYQLDLEGRLLRYPCSYMIYSPAFNALPAVARDAVYRRMWRILSGSETSPLYAGLTKADRTAVVEILRETRQDMPADFGPVVR